MLSPALAALQSALVPLLIALAGVVLAGLALLCWRDPRRNAPPVQQSQPADRALADDSALEVAATRPAPALCPHVVANAPVLLPLAADLLLVDDSAVARAKLRRLFEAAGYRVQLARDGLEALTLLKQGRYRLMVTDLEMPQLDGVALICSCQSQPHTAGMPILAVTGHDDLQARLNDCQEICGIYRKPWIDEDLAGHVAQLVGHRAVHIAEAVEA